MKFLMRQILVMSVIGVMVWGAISFSTTLAETQSTDSVRTLSAEPLTSVPLSSANAWTYALDANQDLWLAYYDERRLLHLRNPRGEDHLLAPPDREQAPSGLAMAAVGNDVSILWRDKFPDKGLYLARGSRMAQGLEALEIGAETEPLANIRAQWIQDRLHALWVGERRDPETGELYFIYHRAVQPDTGKLTSITRLMQGIYPVWASNQNGDLMVLSWIRNQTPVHIAMRFRPHDADPEAEDGGFGPAVKVAEVEEIAPVFEAFQSGDRWFALWLAQMTGDVSGLLLQGAYSDDQGATWQRFSFDGLKGFDIADVKTLADGEGRILMALTGRDRHTNEEGKQDVLLLRSDDHGTTWSSPIYIRAMTDKGGQTDQTREDGLVHALADVHARSPSLAAGGAPGEVLLVWEDWRAIRSRLYASLSTDFGQTWTLSNVPLPHEPGTNLGLRFEPNAAWFQDGRYHLIAEQSTDDGFRTKHLVQLSFTAEELAAWAARAGESVDQAAREALLRERSQAYWQAMLDEDYTTNYDFLDPFFRERVSRIDYLAGMGRIKYTEANLEDVEIDGSRAMVVTQIRASVPPFRAPRTGEMISVPEREAKVFNVWLWLDDNWYKEYYLEGQDLKYTRY